MNYSVRVRFISEMDWTRSNARIALSNSKKKLVSNRANCIFSGFAAFLIWALGPMESNFEYDILDLGVSVGSLGRCFQIICEGE